MDDTMNTDSIYSHLQIQPESRDLDWEEKFFYFFSKSKVQLLNDAPQVGPDNWPYLMVEISNPIDKTEYDLPKTVEDSQKILNWLASKGIGLVVNPQQEYPDYVFTYGMIWNFKETGLFVRHNEGSSNPGPTTMEFDLSNAGKLHAGVPTDKYLPKYVRSIIRNFLLDQGITNPKILVLSADGKNDDLVFSLESLQKPPSAEHPGIAEALSWFLPPHYSIVLMEEQGLPSFVDL